MTAPRGADILAISLATTVAMWTLFYVAAMPPGLIPLWPVAFAIAVGLLAAGLVAGRYAGRGLAGGAAVGVAVGAVNLLVLLSLLGGDRLGEQMISTAKWISGFLAAAVVLGAIGAAIGKTTARARPPANWTARFAWMTALTTLFMLVAGGLVTSLEAGLAVEGWLRPEGHLLILFPLSLMQRDMDTFAEHAHRLLGLLVGVSTIMLMVLVWMGDRRWWLRGLTVLAVLAVAGQGVLGGTRVTEESVALAVVHGIFAQMIFALLVVIASAASFAWYSDREPTVHASAATDRTLSIVLVVVILVQITAGTVFRHLQPLLDVPRTALMGLLNGHAFIGSVLVIAIVLLCGVRAWGIYHDQPIIKRLGTILIHTTMLQVVLGLGSYIVVPKGPRDGIEIPPLEVALTTAHQATGAILLAAAAALFAWQRRLTAPLPAGTRDEGRGTSQE